MPEGLRRIAEALLCLSDQKGLVILYPHVSVDGDALGSALALQFALDKLDVESLVLLDEEPPEKLTFMPGLDRVRVFVESELESLSRRQSLALAVDCSESSRVGRRKPLYDQSSLTAAIDHHKSAGKSTGLKVVETTAAATGELIHALIRQLEKLTECPLIDRPIAICLMGAILSDTGGFVFSNTTSTTFRIASELMNEQIDIREMSYRLFDETSQTKLRLTGEVFSGARFLAGGRIAIGLVSQSLMRRLGAVDEDLDGLVGQLRSARGVDVAFMLRELADGAVRVNIRSDERFDASDFAAHYGGGGHPRAAGMTLTDISLDEAADLVARKAGEVLSPAE